MKANSWMYLEPFETSLLTLDCKCGHKRSVQISTQLEIPCPMCHNSHFVKYGLKDINYTKEFWFHSITSCNEHTGWRMLIYTYLPTKIRSIYGFGRKFHQIAELILTTKGEFHQKISDKELALKKILSQHNQNAIELSLPSFMKFVLQNKYTTLGGLTLKDFQKEDISSIRNKILFFLRNPSLKEMPFYYFDYKDIPKQYYENLTFKEAMLCILGDDKKSLNKAFFTTFENQLKINKLYNPVFDTTFSIHFSDSNFLSRLIALPQNTKSLLFQNLKKIETFTLFLGFLKQYYSEKQLFKFLLSALQNTRDFQYFEDSLLMFEENATFIENTFCKTKPSIVAIHDEISRICDQNINLLNYKKVTFEYQEVYINAEGVFSDFEFRLPYDTYELYQWSKSLNNCLHAYVPKILNNSSVVYGIFKSNTLLYALEISKGKVIQCSGRRNRPLPANAKYPIDLWVQLWHTHKQ